MASTDKIFVSPGVFTSEKDLTFVTRQVGVTTLGLVGETPKGPAFEPVFISDYDEFQKYFGGLNSEKFKGSGYHKYELNYISKSYLSQTNQLYVSRVLGLSGYKAGSAWSLTLDAALDPDTVTETVSATTYGVLLTYSATTAGTPTSLVWGNSNLEALYNDGEISSLFTTIGSKSVGDIIAQSTAKYVKTGTSFSGASFSMEVTSSGLSGTQTTGTTSGTVTEYAGTSYSSVEDVVVATLRSRGAVNASEVMVYNVSATTSVEIGTTPTGYIKDPLSSLSITGTNKDMETFNYNVSFDKTNTNYITSVLGRGAQDKDAELWVEEFYSNTLDDLNSDGKVRGINSTIIQIDKDTVDTNLNDYNEAYKSAASPYVLSELRGNKLYRLFRLVTISDGNAANEDIKFSIINIRPDDKTFDLVVRKFADDDARPTIIEKYSQLSLNPAENGFIGRKIGTTDGEYPLRSKSMMVEMAENWPTNGVPAGFEGVPVRDYIGGNGTAAQPTLEYKTAYSGTDKKRKVYLGLNSVIGVDQDFFNYKGVNDDSDIAVWTGRTDGYHLDSGTTSTSIEGVTITLGDGSIFTPIFNFQVGNAEFRNEASLEGTDYEKINSRKFTFAPYGGWDGWDIYRTERTNDDRYKVSGTRGVAGGPNGTNIFDSYVTTTEETAIDSDYYAYFEGLRTFSNPEAVNINLFATPGIDLRDNIGLVGEAIDMVEEDRADSLYIITTPDLDSGGTVLTEDEAVDIIEDSSVDSNYSATYWPWLQMQDTENNQYLWLPPTGEVVKNIALTDNVAFPWFAAAGLNRGTTTAVKARKKLTLDQRDTLYEGRINPMATFSDVGVVIWGNKTLQSKETALNRINVRRLLLQARKLISAVSIRLLFEQNDDVVRNQFLSLVNPILDNIRKERGLTDFRVQLDNDPEQIDRNELCGRIFIKPTRTLEFICVEFNITNTGANFDNI
jgi:hypothetical protein